jgi:hypothetical protein
MKERGLRMFKYRVPRREEATGDWRKIHEKGHNL